MKWLINAFYWVLTGWYKKYPRDYNLDILLIYLKEVGVENIVTGYEKHEFTVTFKDGTQVITRTNIPQHSWDIKDDESKNKLWLYCGKIIFSPGIAGKKKEIYSWYQKSPSWETLFRYKWLYKNWKRRKKREEKREERRNKREYKRRRKEAKKQARIEAKEERNKFISTHLPQKTLRKMKLKKLEND